MDKKTLFLTAVLTLSATPTALADWKAATDAYSRGDYTTALKEWQVLATKGNASAQYALGLLYRRGLGVEQNYAEALKWYRIAAEQGHAGAQNNLGFMYFRGYGVPRDYVEAHRWYNLATMQGFKKARQNRDRIEERMTPKQVAEAWKLARRWRADHMKRN